MALIKRDRHSKAFSIHRLVQSSFLSYMTLEQRQEHFNNASALVSMAFPRRNAELAELFTMWPDCAKYLQHVLSLNDQFCEQKRNDPSFSALTTYCELNNSCQRHDFPKQPLLVCPADHKPRYLLEIDAHETLEELVQSSFLAMDCIPSDEKTIVMQGEIASHYGQMYCRTGKVDDGIKWLQDSYRTFSSEIPFNATESGWAANNLATGYATAGKWSEALEWYERARDHWLEYSNRSSATQGHWPATIKTSTGRAHFWAGNIDRGIQLLQQAVQQLKSMEGYQWAGFAEYVNLPT